MSNAQNDVIVENINEQLSPEFQDMWLKENRTKFINYLMERENNA